ncbi:MAG: sigma-70 family RNA polymerase sigma factor [Candidatus Sabulitectum sp.]|nr:sigma-70 family RNA polymerase sigma factor [Candidatus Sabulitectum sp.]
MTRSGKTLLAEFWETNYHKLVNFVRTKLDDVSHMDSEDIVQDVILNLLDRPDVTKPISNLTAYVYRALRNKIIDEYRKPGNNVQSLDEPNRQELSLYDIIPDMKYEPENSYAREQLRNQIYTAISDLPPEQKQVIIETEFNEVSFKELENQLNTPIGTLLARKHRGLKTIKKQLNHLKEEHNVLFNS